MLLLLLLPFFAFVFVVFIIFNFHVACWRRSYKWAKNEEARRFYFKKDREKQQANVLTAKVKQVHFSLRIKNFTFIQMYTQTDFICCSLTFYNAYNICFLFLFLLLCRVYVYGLRTCSSRTFFFTRIGIWWCVWSAYIEFQLFFRWKMRWGKGRYWNKRQS